MTKDEAVASAWQMGVIAPWYLRDSQLDIYKLLLSHNRPFVECARQFGKTTTILVYVLEYLIQHPGSICRWCEPWKNQCHEIVFPEVNKLQRDAPERLRFRWKESGSKFVHPNGAILYLRGVNEDKGESSRGPHADIIVADEFGSWKNPRYIVDEVLKPQLETTNGPFIYASTPPEDLGHLYYIYFDDALADSRLIQKTIFDNESLSPERVEEIKRDCGGELSAAWLRERCLKRIKNPELVVVPEFERGRNVLPLDRKRPEYFDAYTGGDSGADDNTVILYAYYDFKSGSVVIEDELVLNNQTTPLIIERSKEKEKALWGTQECRCEIAPYQVGPKVCGTHGIQPYRRVYDADKQLLNDIAREHRYNMELPDKHDKLAAIRAFRRLIQEGKVLISERCRVLIRQMEVGQWSNSKHLDFKRTDDDLELKHLDALAAAIYLVRSVIWTHNPYPDPYAVIDIYKQFPNPTPDSAHADERALAAAFDVMS